MKYLILIILVFMSGYASAEDFYDGEWLESRIDLVYPGQNGDFNIRLANNSICPNRNNYFRVYIGYYGVTEEGANKMYAAALAAAS
ncbi:hypothetical protein BGP77_03900 [Saccharospirillum sp. MSK14-1]|uniref:hypothetical protein n=1 Tax=Saccharospirillum sp. MSK14-1 TaxID=1897632 RepID=UPI000D34377E|nr:hypothetical protein [Saccharospirillum sp. MSK14-1]PTY36452.1 hypothetical protein BGP77_03900 [Saccharospirillum sp. MSK14-1]